MKAVKTNNKNKTKLAGMPHKALNPMYTSSQPTCSYLCEWCDFHTRRITVYIYHLKSKRHIDAYNAASLLSENPSQSNCTQSQSQSPAQRRPAPASWKYKCPQPKCLQEFYTTSIFIEHLSAHSASLRHTEEVKKKFRCPFCNYRASDSDEKDHMKLHRGKRASYRCSSCNFEAVRSSALKFHVDIHHKQNTYKCRVCKFTTKYPNYMQIHERTHAAERKLTCGLCGYQAKKPSYFQRHSKMHEHEGAAEECTTSGENRYFCEKCNFETFNPADVATHEKLHFYERQFNMKRTQVECNNGSNLNTFGCNWSATTWVEQEPCAFLWTIRNFSSIIRSDDIKSPFFRGGTKANHLWQLEVSTKDIKGTEYLAVQLILCRIGHCDTLSTKSVKARFQISLLDAEGDCQKQDGGSTMSALEFQRQTVWGFDNLITMQDLVDPGLGLLSNDTLRIHCRVWVDGKLRQSTDEAGMANEYKTHQEMEFRRLKLLSSDLKAVLDSTLYTDFALVTKTNTFLVHKSILAARSPVFQLKIMKAHLHDNTLEINDFEDEVVEAMLNYMYSGHTDALNDKAIELMKIADKYELSGLKEECEDVIALNLCVENAAETLALAHKNSAFKLTPKVIDFIQRNKEQVRETGDFAILAQANQAVFAFLRL